MKKHLLQTGSVFVGLLALFGFSPSVLAQTNFGSVNIGSSAASTVTLTIPKGGTLSSISVVTQGVPDLDFANAGGGTCSTGTTYAAGATCTVKLSFAPKFAGARYGGVVLADSSGPVATVYLRGTGVGAQTAFYPPSGTLGMTLPVSLQGLPLGIAVDGAGSIYIGDSGSTAANPPSGVARVLKETLSAGNYTQSVIVSGLNSPVSISIDGAGNLYVVDGDTLYKETLSNNAYVQSQIVTGYSYLAVDGSGNLFLSNGEYPTEGVLQANGSYAYTTLPLPPSTSNSAPYRIFSGVASLAVDGNGNLFYITNLLVDDSSTEEQPVSYIDVIEEKLSGGVYSAVEVGGQGFFGPGVKGGEYTGLPAFDLAIDPVGNIYVWEPALATMGSVEPFVGKYTPTNLGLANSEAEPAFPLNIVPYALAVDSAGNVYETGQLSESTADNYTSAVGVFKLDYADPPTVSFAATPVGETGGLLSTGNPAELQIANAGNSQLTFSQASYAADFPFVTGETYIPSSELCTPGTPVAAQAACWMVIDFAPTSPLGSNTSQVLTENLDITTNTLNTSATTQAIALTGTETLPPVSTPTFSIAGGTYTSAQSVSISDSTTGATIYYTTDGTTTPTTSSTKYTGAIAVSATETIQAIAVASGYSSSAVASATYKITPNFTIAATPSSITVTAGQSGNTTITVIPANGFNAAVSFSCSGLPAGASCSFAPQTVTPAGATASTVLTLTTSTSSAAISPISRSLLPATALAVLFCCFGFRKRRGLLMLLLLAISLAGLGMATGCGSGGSNSVQPVTSTITVTAISGSLSHTSTFSLTVN